MEEAGETHGQDHGPGGQAVEKAVLGGGQQGGGGEFFAVAGVVIGHVELHGDGAEEHRQGSEGEGGGGGSGDEAGQGALDELHPHEQDEEGDDEGRQILRPAVAEGVVRVRLLPGEEEAPQRDQGGACVRQVVEAVRLDGQRADQDPQDDLEGAEHQIEEDAHAAADHAVALAHGPLVRFMA